MRVNSKPLPDNEVGSPNSGLAGGLAASVNTASQQALQGSQRLSQPPITLQNLQARSLSPVSGPPVLYDPKKCHEELVDLFGDRLAQNYQGPQIKTSFGTPSEGVWNLVGKLSRG